MSAFWGRVPGQESYPAFLGEGSGGVGCPVPHPGEGVTGPESSPTSLRGVLGGVSCPASRGGGSRVGSWGSWGCPVPRPGKRVPGRESYPVFLGEGFGSGGGVLTHILGRGFRGWGAPPAAEGPL